MGRIYGVQYCGCLASTWHVNRRNFFDDSVARNLLSATGSHFVAIGTNFIITGSNRYTTLVVRRGIIWMRRYLLVCLIFGSRPYVMLLSTSRTSSYVVFLLAAFLPFHVVCARAISRCTLQLSLVVFTVHWLADYRCLLRGLRP